MGRGKKDSSAAGGSVDLVEEKEAAAVAVMEVEEKEEVKGDEEEEEEEEWASAEEQPEEEEADEASAEEPPSPPKLAEGFYEIETIRRRRRRQGQLQYLVKWRGWPESANTWEPAENLRACSVFVEAFEERQQPRSYGKRKRKRKISITPVVSPSPSSHGRRGRPRRSDPRSLSQRPAPERKILPPRASSRRGTGNSNRNLVAGSDASVNVAAQQRLGQGDISVNVAAQQRLGQGATQEGSSNVFWIGLPSVVVHQQDEHQPASDSSVEGPPPQVGQVNDAKKRITKIIKPVRYFANMTDDGHQVSIMTFRALTSDGQTVLVDDKELKSTNPLLLINYYEQRLHNRTTSDSSVEGPPPQVGQVNDAKKRITKIIKPVRYFATMTDDGHQVSMTFRALTSDGQTVLVDDKELKSTNPLLLINYYEQCLHYRTTS